MYTVWCEEKIPFALEAFRNLGNVTLIQGNRLTAQDLKRVDILMIRSGTRVYSDLLDGTPVWLVASPTAGTDHVDTAYLESRNIAFFNAPGCNADSVVEYVLSGLVYLASTRKEDLRGKTVGIIGAGNVGGRLARRLPALGLRVLVNDPPLFESAIETPPFQNVPLDELLEESDIVTCHTPLTREGPHTTFHLLDEPALRRMKKDAWLVNASRGAVISNEALKRVVQDGRLGGVVLDVWENEPLFDPELLALVDIGTAHIAGYSYDGLVNGTIQIYRELARYLDWDGGWDPQSILRPGPEDRFELAPVPGNLAEMAGLRRLIDQLYDIEADDQRFRALMNLPPERRRDGFFRLRKEYPRRRSFHWHHLPVDSDLSEDVRTLLRDALRLNITPAHSAK